MKLNKLKKYILLFGITFMCLSNVVLADNAPSSFNYGYKSGSTANGGKTPDDKVLFNKTSGDYKSYVSNYSTSTYGVDAWKIINSGEYKGKNVFCVDWQLPICLKSSSSSQCKTTGNVVSTKAYKKYASSKWNTTGQHAMILGIAVENMKAKYSGAEQYEKIGAMVNYYFRNNKAFNNAKSSTSYNFTAPASFITKYITEAQEYYKTYVKGKLSTSLTTPKISGNQTLNYNSSNKSYYSNKISFSNLIDEYGNSGDKVRYTISSTVNGKGTALLCDNSPVANTSSCAATKTISIKGSASYYLYVTGSDSNTTISVKISGSNSSNYATSYLYYNTKYPSKYQRLLYPGDITVKRSSSSSLTFSVPDMTKHSVSIQKVDEYGNALSNSSFDLYIDDKKTSWTSTTSNIFKWTSDITTTTADKFKSQTFRIVETKTPDGFTIADKNSTGIIKAAGVGENTDNCYDVNTGEKTDLKYCTNIYSTVCVNSQNKDDIITGDADTTDCSEHTKCSNTTYYDYSTDTGKCELKTTDIIEADGNTTCQEGYHYSDGKCIINSQEELEPSVDPITYTSTCIATDSNVHISIPTNNDGTNDTTGCANAFYHVYSSGTNYFVDYQNVRNNVIISKRSATGSDEIPGASLKICTLSSYKNDGTKCTAAKTVTSGEVGGTSMEWISGEENRVWRGVPVGDYAVIETIAPDGYKKISTVSKFHIDNTGKISAVDNDKNLELENIKDDSGNESQIIVIRNTLNSFSISKTDIATSKELPGAKLTICRTSLNDVDESDNNSDDTNTPEVDNGGTSSDSTEDSTENSDNDSNYGKATPINELEGVIYDQYTGNCIPATLNDGSEATWTSSNEPKTIEGLPAGTYYLVETIAPKGYSTAESILFTMNEDGTLSDKDGKNLSNNKIVMKDEQIKEVKTGDLPILIIVLIAVGTISIGSYYYIQNNSVKENNHQKTPSNNIINKIRKRKIHK